jgi:signal peptidase II
MRSDGKADPGGASGGAAIRDDGGGSGRSRLSARWLAFIVAGLVVVADQLTKWWALDALDDGPIDLIDGFLRLDLTMNTGAAFSLFQGNGQLLGVIAIGVIALIFFVLGDASRRIEAISLGLVLGGAIGNLVDRAFRGDTFLSGAVVDWIDLWFIPTFNVADSAITIGVALLVVAAAFRGR